MFCHQIVSGAVLAGQSGTRGRRTVESLANLPNGDAVLFRGHIDNRAFLRRELSVSPATEANDAELYACCYERYGEDCDLKVIGQYAAIIWSPRTRTVSLVRSPIHAPALHYWSDGRRLIIANVSQAIFATGEIRPEVDEQKIADTLYLNYAEEERGWFKGVKRLPLGTRCEISKSGTRSYRYYDLGRLPRVRLARDDDYVEAADALFTEATRAALNGFSRPAVSLSGGLDSQAVAAYAVKVLGPERRLAAFTAVPEAGWDGRTAKNRFGDESAYAALLARSYPTIDHEILDAAGLSFGHKLGSLFLTMGAPPRNAMNLHWIHALRARARERGCDVLLTGSLGNATFSFEGKGALPALLKRGRLLALAREVRAIPNRRAGLLRTALTEAVLPFLPERVCRTLHNRPSGTDRDDLPDWCGLNPDWALRMRVRERARNGGIDPTSRSPSRTLAIRRARLVGLAESGDLIQAIDTIGGLPQRDPTSYRPFFEFCLGIPDEQFLHRGEKRWLARRLLMGKIPDVVLNEKRQGLQAADWHLRLGRERSVLQTEVERLSKDPGMEARFDLKRFRAALKHWPQSTPVDDARALKTLWLALPRALATARFIQYVEGHNT
ncbi:MAG: asparagine synthase-related protein [Hyphomicrobiales bacterium]